MTDEELQLERELRQQLADLDRNYRKEAAPIVNQLVNMYQRRIPAHIYVMDEHARKMGQPFNPLDHEQTR